MMATENKRIKICFKNINLYKEHDQFSNLYLQKKPDSYSFLNMTIA